MSPDHSRPRLPCWWTPTPARVVYAKNEHEELYPASLTKIMTALLVLEAVDSGQLSLDQTSHRFRRAPWTGWRRTAAPPASRRARQLTVEQLLYCMLIVSANEACNILAEAVSGSVDAFVDAMNEKAAGAGL